MEKKMDNVVSFSQPNMNDDIFQIKGSLVDFPMKEDLIPYFWDKKGIYRVNEEGEIMQGLGIVGHTYPLNTHVDFFSAQHEMLQRKFPAAHLENVSTKYRTSRDGAWALQDITFPSVTHIIDNGKHKTEIALRNISWHSVDGSASNNAVFGGIDFFCTNGMITGEFDTVRKKNTKNFDMRKFIDEIEKSVEEFYVSIRKYQAWANRDISFEDAKCVVENLPVADRSKEKLLNIYKQEATDRGNTVWALYSAFTNYSSHTDNGFAVRQTKNDHEAQTMLNREFEVAKWVATEEFVRLAA
jgi:hypothetical protein